MTNHRAGRLASLGFLLVLAACGSSAEHRTVHLLNDRLQYMLTPAIAAGRAVVQPVPDGARVTLLDTSLYPNGPTALEDQSPDVRANVIEGLLDPSLMRVQVADTSALPASQQDIRVQNVQQYFAANGLGSVLVPPEPAPAISGPAGLTITINVQCPRPDGLIGYGSGKPNPVCE